MTPNTLLSQREREFLNDILRLKNDNHNWNGKHMIDCTFNGDNGNGDKWTYQYQGSCKSHGILADAELWIN